ncbi:hypothetical protein PCASD_20102 [Puccinia coronata f. sp. avenae]|uniref:Uncharacterized protein n=1 Tax=Puccinia coronata f. sp. avenae TaxID=200324 RepID=A0A2N5U5D4_9BASI|nr:hypothetical protein PCASD_20102 [Puccinia coronata f. sp. avenae]
MLGQGGCAARHSQGLHLSPFLFYHQHPVGPAHPPFQPLAGWVPSHPPHHTTGFPISQLINLTRLPSPGTHSTNNGLVQSTPPKP